jgi:KAP family P-loop domain
MPWQFLSDSAVDTENQDKFGTHTAYAKVLYHIASTCNTPFSIALYSGWGTGKTSICNLFRQEAVGNGNIHYVYLDVWKYSDDPLKRWILLETCRSLVEQKAIEDYQIGGRSLQSHLEFEESWQDREKLKISFQAIRWLGLSVIVLVAVFVGLLFLPPTNSKILHILSPLSALLVAGGITTLLFESVIKELFKALSGLVIERNVRHVSAKPAFSSEKFSELFRDVVRRATSPNESHKKRIVFVFDNLDRCSEQVAVETIGVIKTYLDEPGCVYVIPCDEIALMRHISKSYIGQTGPGDGRKYAKEFLNKFFQTTLRLPIAPELDIESYLDQQLLAAGMSDLPADARDVLVLGYLGQTPRQIKRVLNDLISYRSLAVQAESANLVETGALTSDLPLLTKMSVVSVEWPDFLNRLADDPELWSELMNMIATGRETNSDIGAELTSFLRATRHVSPGADVRPFIYLKRVKYERNIAVAKSVQNSMRKGESKEFLELIQQADPLSAREEIVRIATDLAKKWLAADPPREVFLKNSMPLLLKAANLVPENRNLELTISDLLSHFSMAAPTALAEIVALPDLFVFSPTIETTQKERCLERLVDLFEPSAKFNESYRQYWREFLQYSDQLSARLRSRLSNYLEERYSTEPGLVIAYVHDASKREENTDWVLGPTILAHLALDALFSGDAIEEQRLEILVKYQSRMKDEEKSTLTTGLVNSLQGTRTRSLDAQANVAIWFLNRIDPSSLGPVNLGKVATVLIEQVTAHGGFGEKAPWFVPLIAIYRGLDETVQTQTDSLVQPVLLDSSDPNGPIQLLMAMKPNVCAQLLQLPGYVKIFHDQASRLEVRFNAGQAQAYREQFLNCFSSASVLTDLSIFDEDRIWDLQLFTKVLIRGQEEKLADEYLRERTTAFVERFVRGQVSTYITVYDQLVEVSHNLPDLLNETVALSLSTCCLEVIATNVEKYFSDLRYLTTKLSAQNRVRLARELVEDVLKPRQPNWIKVLQKMTEDLANDESIATEKNVVKDMNDFAFEAALVSPSEATDIFVNLRPYLSQELYEENLDEAADRLLGLEGAGSSIDSMEPYLSILKGAAAAPINSPHEKLVKFCLRMLGPAKTDDDKIAVLKFLQHFRSLSFEKAVQDRVGELSSGEGPVADAAKQAAEIP